MKCPLFTTSSIDKGGIIHYKRWECLKEECAWWDGHGGFCGVLKISRHLEGLTNQLDAIVDKMPHEGQFRK